MVARVDGDHPGTVFFGLDQVVHGVGSGNHPGRIPAPQDDQLGIEQVLPAVAHHHRAILGQRSPHGAFGRNIAIVGSTTAELVQQPGGGQAAVVQPCQVTAASSQQDAGVSVGFLYAFKLARQGIQHTHNPYRKNLSVLLWKDRSYYTISIHLPVLMVSLKDLGW